MRILATSDWHVDFVTAGVRRFHELESAARQTVVAAIEEHADVFLFLGDLCDPDTGSAVFRCIELAQTLALALRRAGIRSFWMAGNHDVIEDGSGDTTLTPLHSIESLDGRAGAIRVVERPEEVDVDGVRFTFMPFTATSHHYDPRAHATHTSTLLPQVFVGHLSIDGIIPGEETNEMGRGRDLRFPYEEVLDHRGERPTLLLNGHYHRRQAYYPLRRDTKQFGDLPINVPGSLARLTFGEEHHSPGWLLVEIG